jgi:hypothetical protein
MNEQANVQTNCTNETNNNKSAKAKRYILWHRQFAHLELIKLRKLHEVIILQKSIFVVEDLINPCEIYALIKICNKRNHYVSERKASILALVSIDIYESLSISRQKY